MSRQILQNEDDVPVVMVVDDTPANLKLLDLMLRETYRVVSFNRGETALSAAIENPPDIVLLDINMPGMDGFEVCRRMKTYRQLHEVPVIFISALADTADKVKAFTTGGVDYVTKPFHVDEVKARVATHLTVSGLRNELQKHNEHLEQLVQEKIQEVHDSQIATIVALAKLAEHRDTDTGRHLERVQSYTKLLARHLQRSEHFADRISDSFVSSLYHASPLHDIGKVSIPDSILLKPDRLTRDEFEIMKTHTVVGAQTLESVHRRYRNNEFLTVGLALTRSHHEHWDGSGYPEGIAGEAIPLEGRIMAVADVYDALRTRRVYKPACDHATTRDTILEASGTQFDPRVVEAFLAIEAEFEEVSRAMED